MDDAVMDVEKYIDDAFISGLKEVTDHTWTRRRDPANRVFSDSAEAKQERRRLPQTEAINEGGDGVTVVKLK